MPVVVESFHLDSSNSNNNNFVRGTRRIRQQLQQQQQQTTLSMCICINCQLVTSCKAYHFVETKHEQPHMTNTPTFLPREGSPTINVNIRTEQNQIENDDGEHKDDEDDNEYNNEDADEMIKRQRSSSSSMWKDQVQQQDDDDHHHHHHHSSPITTPAINNNNDAVVVPIDVASSDSNSDSKSVSKTTIEYDVVKCEDFILDKNCWIINMPEEIKRLNPDFVPS